MLSTTNRKEFVTLLDAVTLAQPDGRPAIIYVETGREAEVVSRQQFSQRVAEAARSMTALGIRPRDLVVIAHTQSLEAIYAFWGALRLGAIPSMFPTLTEKLDPDVYMSNMAELVKLSQVAAVLTTDAFKEELAAHLSCPVYGSGDLAAANKPIELKEHPAPPDEVAFLQHSSGTTGLQKGVALSHSAVLNQLAAYSDAIELREADVIVSWLPLYHDMGLIAGFLLPLVQGVPLVLMSPFDWVSHPALLFQAIHDYRGTLCWLPNFAYNHCARRIRRRDMEGLSAASMRMFINCSEPVRHDSHQLFLERFAANGVQEYMLAASYAMAENTFAVTQTRPGAPPRVDVIDGETLDSLGIAVAADPEAPGSQFRVSCGLPIAGSEVQVVGEDRQWLSERLVGELVINSDCLLTGYYMRDDLRPFDDDGWFLTGDMGYIANGEVYVVGRRKDLIINAGKNIYPADIEAVVNGVAGVKAGRAVAFGVEDEREGTELIAVVAEVSDDILADEAARREIGREIRREVARQMMVTVSYVHLVGSKWLLKTSSGKLARGANRDKWLYERDGQA